MLLHQQVRGDDPLNSSHKLQLQFEAGDFLNQGALALKHKVYRKTHSLDSPSDRHGILLSGNLRQKACCERQVVSPLSMVLFAPILLEKLVHRQYLHDRDHAPKNTNSYNSLALLE